MKAGHPVDLQRRSACTLATGIGNVSSLSLEERKALLKNCQFLAAAPSAMLDSLAATARVEDYAQGRAVVTAGETGDTMYVIASGRARVHQGEVVLAELEQGNLFGEMTVLDEQVRSATVTTLEDSTLPPISMTLR